VDRKNERVDRKMNQERNGRKEGRKPRRKEDTGGRTDECGERGTGRMGKKNQKGAEMEIVRLKLTLKQRHIRAAACWRNICRAIDLWRCGNTDL
jgi:hypothetical protein